ncbi:MAG: hypothetical protein KDI59_08460 [Xanthomonadales bacterium]|nr:hypothetical protein [Xanthomonadales bacterium]
MAKKEAYIDTRKFFLFNIWYFIRFALSGQVVFTLIFYSIFSIHLDTNNYTIIISYLVNLVFLALFYNFAFEVLVESARGNMSPLFDKSYPVSDEVFLKVAFLSLMIEMILFLIAEKGYGEQVAYSFQILTTFITPAIFMVLALTDSLLLAFHPRVLIKVIGASFSSYIVFVLFWFGASKLYDSVINIYAYEYLPVFANQVVSVFFKFLLLIINFHIMGYLVFQNRYLYDLEYLGFKNIDDDILKVKYNKIVTTHEEVKKHIRFHEFDNALNLIADLQRNGDYSPELEELKQQAETRKKYTPTNMDVADRAHTYLNANKRREAFHLVINHIKSGNEYTEVAAFDISRLVQYAMITNQTEYVAHFVRGFHEKYPYHEDIVRNYFSLVQVLYKNRKTRAKAKELLLTLIEDYPNDRYMPEILSWYKGLKLIEKAPKIVN